MTGIISILKQGKNEKFIKQFAGAVIENSFLLDEEQNYIIWME